MKNKIISRAPYSKLINFILMVSLTICGVGCSGGTGSTGSTSNDNKNIQVATGTIIGFGSVIVNGIRYTRKSGLADDRVKLRFENNTSAGEANLRVGMIVNVTGTIDAATETGEYESIEFQPEIRGPLDASGVDTTKGTFTIMGRTIQVDSNTNFENIRDLTEIKEEMLNHPELEISGNLDNNTGIIHATRVARKADDFNTLPVRTVQLKGKISTANATSGSFTIDGVTVNFSATSLGLNTVSADIADGVIVEVKGTVNDAGTVVTASRVEKKNAVDAAVNGFVCVKGTATGGIDNKTITINGPNGAITVNAAGAVYQIGDASATSAISTAGATLEVEGKLQPDGSITATRVYIDTDKSVKLEGNALAGAFNAIINNLTLNGVQVAIAATTRLVGNKGTPLDLSQIKEGDHLQIVGLFDITTGKVKASQVQVTAASTVTFIQGPVTNITNSNMTLIGMITVDPAAVAINHKFFDNRTGIHSVVDGPSAFIAAVSDGHTVVRATGTVSGTVLSATELELEQAQ